MKPHHKPTDPIALEQDIGRIKAKLADSPRDFALFTLGTNTAFRGGDILSLNVGDVRNLKPGDTLKVKEQKTGKWRMVTVNASVVAAIDKLLASESWASDDEPLFRGKKLRTRLTIETLGRLTKRWCERAGLKGSFASHSLRKTWAYQNRKAGADILTIQKALGHSSPATTMAYMCIQSAEMTELYMREI